MKRFLLLVLGTILAACGGTSAPQPQPPAPLPGDTLSPRLEASLPANGASGVPINTELSLIFSEALEPSSLSVSASPPLTLGTPSWDETGSSVRLANADLSASASYTLVLTAQDLAGNLLAPTTLAFTTAATADRSAPRPPMGLVATPANAQVTLTWQANPEADIAGYDVYWGTSPTALESHTFVPATSHTVRGLSNDSSYFFAVAAQDAASNLSRKTAPVSATPSATLRDSTPPTIQASTPADSATGIMGEFAFFVTFSEPLELGSLRFSLEPAEYPLLASWSANDTVLMLVPQSLHMFTENTPYALTLDARDKAGNPLAGGKVITFTTGKAAPRVISSTPEDGATAVPAGLVPDQEITLLFSEAVDPASFQASTDANCNTGSLSEGNTRVTFPQCQFFDEHTYTVNVGGQSATGSAFTDSISFSTVADTTPPSVESTLPGNGLTLVPTDTFIFIDFDDEMDEASTRAAIISSLPLGCSWDFQFTYSPSCGPVDLEAGTSYTLAVGNGAKDTSGNALVSPYSFSFTTESSTNTSPGRLSVSISGAPAGLASVSVAGPGGYSRGLDSSTSLENLAPGDYTVTARGFGTGLPSKPICRIYTSTPSTQTATVAAGQTATANIVYEWESCSDTGP